MVKQLIGTDIGTYIFDASAKTITISGLTTLTLDQILVITNITDNIIIYNFAEPSNGGTISSNTITLNYDTTSMSDTDDLQIWIDYNFLPDDAINDKDLDIPNSDIGGFTGSVGDLFNNYNTEIEDTSATNPKIFKLRFKRPVSSNAIGLGSKTGNFSNIKVLLKDLAGTTRVTIDKSTDNTKYTSNVYPFEHSEFIEAEIQFHTVDPITLNGSFIPKQIHTVSVISGINDVTGLAEQVKVDNGEFIIGGKIGLKDSNNNNIDPATEDSLSGPSVNGNVELIDANTWYQIPESGSVPAENYKLVITKENVSGTLRWGFDNTGTPSATNGNKVLEGSIVVNLAGGEVLYLSSDTSADDVNWSTKRK